MADKVKKAKETKTVYGDIPEKAHRVFKSEASLRGFTQKEFFGIVIQDWLEANTTYRRK